MASGPKLKDPHNQSRSTLPHYPRHFSEAPLPELPLFLKPQKKYKPHQHIEVPDIFPVQPSTLPPRPAFSMHYPISYNLAINQVAMICRALSGVISPYKKFAPPLFHAHQTRSRSQSPDTTGLGNHNVSETSFSNGIQNG